MARPNLLNLVQEAQKSDEKISTIVSHNRMGKETEFLVNEDGFLYYKDRVCVPNDNKLKRSFLKRHIVDPLLYILVARKCIKI